MNNENKKFNTVLDYYKYYEKIQPDKVCIEYENNVLTYGFFGKKARRIAKELSKYGMHKKRVVLIFPSGLEYVLGFFAALFVGAIPVPCYPANESSTFDERFLHIITNSKADFVLTMSNEKGKIDDLNNKDINNLNIEWIYMDKMSCGEEEYENYAQVLDAFIQYSSGTTSNPKGVLVSHANLLNNIEQINSILLKGKKQEENIIAVSWLPLYHDMGLIGGMLLYIVMGHTIHLMPTLKTLKNPYLWLNKISEVRGNVTLAPNFAFQSCTDAIRKEQLNDLDLSSLRVIINGAEPISIQILNNFYEHFKETGLKEEAMCPCYGLAEATLLVSNCEVEEKPVFEYFHQKELEKGTVAACPSNEADAIPIVSCGSIVKGTEVIIVDTHKNTMAEQGKTGEIWINGPAVTDGYYNNAVLSKEVFHAKLGNNTNKTYLRTGDLGFFHNGELYLCGRMKELIIVNGKNISPSNLEQFILNIYLTQISKVVFFSVVTGNNEQVICVVEQSNQLVNTKDISTKIREDIESKFNIRLSEVIAVRVGTIEKTESGKIKRNQCKQMYLEGELDKFRTGLIT